MLFLKPSAIFVLIWFELFFIFLFFPPLEKLNLRKTKFNLKKKERGKKKLWSGIVRDEIGRVWRGILRADKWGDDFGRWIGIMQCWWMRTWVLKVSGGYTLTGHWRRVCRTLRCQKLLYINYYTLLRRRGIGSSGY